MALHLSYTISHQSWTTSTPITSSDSTRCCVTATRSLRRIEQGSSNSMSTCYGVADSRMVREKVRVKCASLETVGVETENLVGKVTEVNKDTFWPIVNAAQDKILVLDMFTQWCGPCKVIAPKFEKLAQENLDMIFLKLDCNQENKALAKELGIRVVPTFKILRDGKVVKEVTGAKLDDLVKGINDVQST